MNKSIILASASPRRRELLKQIGLEFEVVVSEVEEKITSAVPFEVVEQLSAQKAEACKKSVEAAFLEKDTPFVVIGADTVVSVDGQILGKPKDTAEAVKMLQTLQGRSHEVYTGVTLLYVREGRDIQKNTFHERTVVSFYEMSEEEIRSYAETGDPLDKAGAYGIQGPCARFIKGVEGDYNNVVGLPAGRVYQELKKWL